MIKQDVYDEVQGLEPLCQEICHTLWNHPELSGNERESANFLRKILSEEGFTIENNEHLEHAFIAEYGKGKPVIAILGEYDALPGLSQKADIKKEDHGNFFKLIYDTGKRQTQAGAGGNWGFGKSVY